MSQLKQSTARDKMIFMTDSADHVTGKTGLTLTLTLSKNGGAFTSISPTVTERGNGWYSLALTSSHTDTLGDFVVRATATGADAADIPWEVVAGLPGETVTLAAVTHTGAVIPTVTTLTGHTPQTGDAYARLGAPSGASVSADVAAIQSDTNDIQSRLPAALVGGKMDAVATVSGAMDANVVSIDGQLTSGNNATLNLKQLNIVNSGGDAILAQSTGSDGCGIKAVGYAYGEGIHAEGGNVGHGLECAGGSTYAHGIYAHSTGISFAGQSGIYATGSGGGPGVYFAGDGVGPGIEVKGGTTGAGAKFTGGSTSGKGIDANGTGGQPDIEGNITGNVSGSVNSVTSDVNISTTSISAIWAYVVTGAFTAVQLMRGFAAVLMGESSGHESGTPKYRDLDDTKNVIDAITDANGNRTSVTKDLS